MTEPTELHPIVERTREKVRQTHVLRARELLVDLVRPVLMPYARDELASKFPEDPDHFFDNFTQSRYHSDLKVLACDFCECSGDLPGQTVSAARLVYTASHNDEDEVNRRPDDLPDDEEWEPTDVATYTESRCWLLSATMALVATTRMGEPDDNSHSANGDFEIVHSDNRKALRSFIALMMEDFPDQVEKGNAVLDEVLGADSATPESARTPGPHRP